MDTFVIYQVYVNKKSQIVIKNGYKDGREKLDLMRAVPVRIGRIRLERRRIDEGIVGAMDLHAARRVSKRAFLTPLRNLRTVAGHEA